MRTAPTEILAALEHAGRDTARVIRPIPNARVGDGFVTGSAFVHAMRLITGVDHA
jgi:hypothetical protein